jgi:hypothetical protein
MSTITAATIQAQLAKMIKPVRFKTRLPMVQVSHGGHFTSWIHQHSLPANRNLLHLEYRNLLMLPIYMAWLMNDQKDVSELQPDLCTLSDDWLMPFLVGKYKVMQVSARKCNIKKMIAISFT